MTNSKLLKATLLSTVGLFILLALSKNIAFVNTLVIVYEVIVPVEILNRLNIRLDRFNIYLCSIDQTKKELLFLSKVIAATFIPYTLLYLGAHYIYANLNGISLNFNLTYTNLITLFFIQTLAVALPEEIFFRGFLQGSLTSLLPKHKLLAIILVNIIFALSHVVGNFSPIRLLTFFPGLVFSYLVYKQKSLFSAVLYHSLCNILGHILFLSVSYTP